MLALLVIKLTLLFLEKCSDSINGQEWNHSAIKTLKSSYTR